MEKKKTANPIGKTLVAKMKNWLRLIRPFYAKKIGVLTISFLGYES